MFAQKHFHIVFFSFFAKKTMANGETNEEQFKCIFGSWLVTHSVFLSRVKTSSDNLTKFVPCKQQKWPILFRYFSLESNYMGRRIVSTAHELLYVGSSSNEMIIQLHLLFFCVHWKLYSMQEQKKWDDINEESGSLASISSPLCSHTILNRYFHTSDYKR